MAEAQHPVIHVLGDGLALCDCQEGQVSFVFPGASRSPDIVVPCTEGGPLSCVLPVGNDLSVAAITSLGALCIVVLDPLRHRASLHTFGHLPEPIVAIVAAEGEHVVVVTVSGEALVVAMRSLACAVVAKVDPGDATALRGCFAHDDPTVCALLGGPDAADGAIVVIRGVGLGPVAQLDAVAPPTIVPHLCAGCQMSAPRDGTVTLVSYGDAVTHHTAASLATPKATGACVTRVTLSRTRCANDPITTACAAPDAQLLLVTTVSGKMRVISPTQSSMFSTTVARAERWVRVKWLPGDATVWAVCLTGEAQQRWVGAVTLS